MPVKRRVFAYARKVAGYSQEGLAERLGVDRTTVARWETGDSAPQPCQRPRIAEALGVSLTDLDQLLQEAALSSGDEQLPARTQEHGREAEQVGEPAPAGAPRTIAPNDQLRAARERTASVIHPEECLSRQELAELVNTWVWEHRHTMVEASANWVGKLERGKMRWPGKLYREALRAIFGAPTDSALGFVNTRRAVVKLKDVDRRQFIHTGAGLGVGALALDGPLAALLEGGEPTPVPARIGATEIEQIRTAGSVFADWDFTYGGGLVKEAVMGQLRYSARLLDATCPERLRPELHSAVGDMANTAGYMCFDVGAYDQARRVLRVALTCAEKAGDWQLRAYVLDSMALLEIRAGQPDEGLTLAEHGLVRPDRLTEAGQSMLHTSRARALARMRRTQDTLTAVGTAEDHFAQVIAANEPPFLTYYNAAFLAGNTGQALFDLAVLGHDPARATERLTTAAAEHAASHARPRAICLTKLASLTMATGDPIQAALIGMDALDAVGTVSSRRTTDDLRELACYATAHQHLNEVAHLRRRIATLLLRT